MDAVLAAPDRLMVQDDGLSIAEYVFAPQEAIVDSPRPSMMLRTHQGRPVTASAPEDHPWHRGLSLALPYVGSSNFWGGPTYVHHDGYRALPNHGIQRHRAWEILSHGRAGSTETVRARESLEWISPSGERLLAEQRTLIVWPVSDGTWAVFWHSRLTNETHTPLSLGSPATNGRLGAGYGGIFWRGSAAFRHGKFIGPSGEIDEREVSARPADWLSMLSSDGEIGVLMAVDERSLWFARSDQYPGLGPAPFSRDERLLPPSEAITLAVTTAVIEGLAGCSDPLGHILEAAERTADAHKRLHAESTAKA
ncbi:DUF6807 family protein [Microbacterium sp. XT11]|uniref:DUF6807 family protein n=1 Tax=Microbacterium sp. XT11 TaxID=367477 RepID=UPI000742D67C|nr:DUF6807 family protein [Microbacterium sp. XT11]ALX66171.1 hypothetical protein AB663_001105 [Microbacterium sp. XT11]